MSAVHRFHVLEQQAGNILLSLGYEPMIVSDIVRTSRYIPYNLTARKELDDGTIDNVMVKLKISLRPLVSLSDAEEFCRDEMGRMKKFFLQLPSGLLASRFEVWISIPSRQFQQFEITRDGIREILCRGQNAGGDGGAV
ncbi:MAG: hypothetical protein PHD55_03900 [Methanoregula sp.]|jgi:hypothetical protein|nr:hypothetical protein [Methanoregula sp.]